MDLDRETIDYLQSLYMEKIQILGQEMNPNEFNISDNDIIKLAYFDGWIKHTTEKSIYLKIEMDGETTKCNILGLREYYSNWNNVIRLKHIINHTPVDMLNIDYNMVKYYHRGTDDNNADQSYEFLLDSKHSTKAMIKAVLKFIDINIEEKDIKNGIKNNNNMGESEGGN